MVYLQFSSKLFVVNSVFSWNFPQHVAQMVDHVFTSFVHHFDAVSLLGSHIIKVFNANNRTFSVD